MQQRLLTMLHGAMTDQLSRLAASLATRYGIEREVGRGGMATVYLARDFKHRRQVALKVLHPLIAAAIGQDRFLQEIEVAARLRHPHILPLHDSGEADGLLYYVMPYVEGESLRDRLSRERQLAIPEAVHIAREVADALAYAHSQGVIHRDIKPANIMLESNHAVVTDFGIALVASRSGPAIRHTGSGLSPGTPEYMSPEQVEGYHHVDGRSDIYSLGCVLFEMLAGEPPFTGGTPSAVLMRKVGESPRGLRVVRPSVSPAMEQVVLTALATAPADRYQSAAEFGQALDGATAERPLAPPAASLGSGAGSRWLAIGLGVVGTVIALVTGIGLLSTVAYDVKLQMPSQFTPSRTDFPLIGIRALIPGLSIVFLGLVGYVVAAYLLRLIGLGLWKLPGVGSSLDRAGRRVRDLARRVGRRTNPVAAAELFFVLALGISALVLSRFGPLLAALVTDRIDPLSLASRPMHRAWTVSLAALIAGMAIGWRRVFRELARRQAAGFRFQLAKWGSFAWLVILVFIMTLPWRLLWDNELPRALLRGERVYVLRERGSDLVLYNRDRRVTERYQNDGDAELERRQTVGYVFESTDAFDQGRPSR